MSDTHGKKGPTVAAVSLFDSLGVEHIIHCGDVGGTDVLDELAGRRCSVVWGNMDSPSGGMSAYLQTVGITPPPLPPLKLDLAGRRSWSSTVTSRV